MRILPYPRQSSPFAHHAKQAPDPLASRLEAVQQSEPQRESTERLDPLLQVALESIDTRNEPLFLEQEQLPPPSQHHLDDADFAWLLRKNDKLHRSNLQVLL